ncbi:hypothetical protein GCM10009718_35090 [Isoptericola halotolerans]|uniref:Uncharacterized protein n=1 Tax=Isoptericola halotolerans TaxID=300560 RepID=A0ABX2A2T2_9MICO|nr:hypothetical protein [Isoptericola halotolerans]NOV97154.1 hypothetical protein [Isoptericola halotolerans]
MGDEQRFRGQILGCGTTSGTRVVVGHWRESPFGAFADAMVEDATGHRVLVAPPQVAGFVATTYRFDDVVETAVTVRVEGPRAGRGVGHVVVEAGPLRLRAAVGRRTALGRVLRLVPPRLAAAPQFALLSDPVARVLLRGVRTRGSAGNGRHETYGATDMHALSALRASWDGGDLGELADVDPPVRFGFGSTPRQPSLTQVVTTVRG